MSSFLRSSEENDFAALEMKLEKKQKLGQIYESTEKTVIDGHNLSDTEERDEN